MRMTSSASFMAVSLCAAVIGFHGIAGTALEAQTRPRPAVAAGRLLRS